MSTFADRFKEQGMQPSRVSRIISGMSSSSGATWTRFPKMLNPANAVRHEMARSFIGDRTGSRARMGSRQVLVGQKIIQIVRERTDDSGFVC